MERVDKLVYRLSGTNISLEEACSDLGFNRADLSIQELQELDNWIFYCDNCGWWCDIGDRASNHNFPYYDNICCDCAGEEEEF